MIKLEEKILEQLEKEAKVWIEQEYKRRQERIREEIEKQIAWAQQEGGTAGADGVRAFHERAKGYAMTELFNDVQFEADQWIIAEMEQRKAKAQSSEPKAKATPKKKAAATKAKTASKAKPAAAKAKAKK